jgi:hypothetical protein
MNTGTAMIMTTMIMRMAMAITMGITTAITIITRRSTWAAPSPSAWG